jgi:hypothetical protein
MVHNQITPSPLFPSPACGRGQGEGRGVCRAYKDSYDARTRLHPLLNHATFCGPKSRVPQAGEGIFGREAA